MKMIRKLTGVYFGNCEVCGKPLSEKGTNLKTKLCADHEAERIFELNKGRILDLIAGYKK